MTAGMRMMLAVAAATAVTLPTAIEAQDRSIFSVLDTGGRSVAPAMAADGQLSDTDVLSAGGRRVQVWGLSAAPGAELQVDLRSADFDAFLYVVGPGLGEGLRDDDGGDGLNSRLCMSLDEVGEYRIVASSLSGGTGAFTLEVSEAPGATNGTCPIGGGAVTEVTDVEELSTEGRVLSIGDDTQGTLRDTDPVLFSSPAQAWAIEGQAGTSVSVDLLSEAFDAYLIVSGPGLDAWLQDDDGAGRCDSRVTLDFPQTGTYRVVVSTLGTTGGPYRLIASSQPREVDPTGCIGPITEEDEPDLSDLSTVSDVGTLTYESEVAGSMTGSEGLFEGRYVQGWTLSGSAGDQVSIELRSADFDSYLFLLGPGFPDPLWDDDGAGNLHSRICVELPESGTYRILAGPLSGVDAGDRYTLEASRADADTECTSFEISPALMASSLGQLPTEGRTLAVGQVLTGSIDLSAARHPETNQLIQPWRFDAQAGQTVYIDVVSEEFDPLLYVVGPGVDGWLFVDDAGDGCNTRMELTPSTSGPLTLLPGSYYEMASGNFIIRASTNPGPIEAGGCVGADAASSGGITSDAGVLMSVATGMDRLLTVGTEAQGSLGFGDDQLTTGLPAQAWTVSVEAGRSYVFELISDDFDAVLYLDGPGLASPLMDDDGAGDLNSRIEFTAGETGTMRLVATALSSDGAGSFRIRALLQIR